MFARFVALVWVFCLANTLLFGQAWVYQPVYYAGTIGQQGVGGLQNLQKKQLVNVVGSAAILPDTAKVALYGGLGFPNNNEQKIGRFGGVVRYKRFNVSASYAGVGFGLPLSAIGEKSLVKTHNFSAGFAAQLARSLSIQASFGVVNIFADGLHQKHFLPGLSIAYRPLRMLTLGVQALNPTRIKSQTEIYTQTDSTNPFQTTGKFSTTGKGAAMYRGYGAATLIDIYVVRLDALAEVRYATIDNSIHDGKSASGRVSSTFGGELSFFNIATLRGAYQFGSAVLGKTHFTGGVGVKLGELSVDYAYVRTVYFSQYPTHQVGLSANF